METIALLTVMAFALPLLMLAAPFSLYVVPALLIGITISYGAHRWRTRRVG